MANISKADVKLYQSQRLDDTDQGGGAMTAVEVVDGAVNNLFPDISRLDRVYGRVSARKAYLAIITADRSTYYGSHAVVTQQAADPLVGISFFTTKDWFDVRSEAQTRVESYLAKGSIFGISLYGNHYQGSRSLRFYTGTDGPEPIVGEVVVLNTKYDLDGALITETDQYVRITEVSSEEKSFVVDSQTVKKKIIDCSIGQMLTQDFPGKEIVRDTKYSTDLTRVYSTVVADSARYYGISPLAEDVSAGSLIVRASDVTVPLVPSAQSETAVVDFGIGGTSNPMIQPQANPTQVTRTLSGTMEPSNSFLIGEGLLPGTLACVSLGITDNAKGNVIQSGVAIGGIEYNTGTITWATDAPGGAFTGSFTYVPASPPTMFTDADGLYVDIQNRGYVYTFFCNPIPAPGTLRVDFLSGGKWYSLRDQGNGELKGTDASIGSGALSFITGSVSVSLGALPDADSMLLFFWAVPQRFYDLSGETKNFEYEITLQDEGIAAGTFEITWTDGSDYRIWDNGGALDFEVVGGATTPGVGTIDYVNGTVSITSLPVTPLHSQVFSVSYNQGAPETEVFAAPIRSGPNRVDLDLSNAGAIVPGSVRIKWVNLIDFHNEINYPTTSKTYMPAYNSLSLAFEDDGAGGLADETNNAPDWAAAVVTYTAGAGAISFSPDRNEEVLMRTATYFQLSGGYT